VKPVLFTEKEGNALLLAIANLCTGLAANEAALGSALDRAEKKLRAAQVLEDVFGFDAGIEVGGTTHKVPPGEGEK
jgi:hypothetical protein